MLLQSLRAIGRNVNRAASLCIFFVSLSAQAAAPSFESVPGLSGPGVISRDGSTLAGDGYLDDAAFRMSRGTGTRELLPSPEGAYSSDTRVRAISDDGTKIAGSFFNFDQGREACVWTGDSVQPLGQPNGFESEANFISADGSVVFGSVSRTIEVPGDSPPLLERKMFRWTASGGMQVFSNPPGFDEGTPWAALRDGSAVYAVGYLSEPGLTPDGGGHPNRNRLSVVRWDANGEFTLVTAPPGHVIAGIPVVAPGDGSVLVPVAPPSLNLPPESFRWMRWRTNGSELLPQLIQAGRVVNGSVVATSDDGETQIFEVGGYHYRFFAGEYVRMGNFEFSHASADCSVVVGLRSSAKSAQPIVWMQESGVVDLLPHLRDQLASTAPLGGNWNESFVMTPLVTRNGDTISCVGARTARSGPKTCLMEVSAASLAAPAHFSGDLLVGATVAFSERYEEPEHTYQNSLVIRLPLRMNEAESFEGDSVVELALGNTRIRKLLGDDPEYSTTRWKARLPVVNGAVLDLSWTETELTLKFSTRRIDELLSGPALDEFLLENLSDQSSFKITGTTPLSLRIGDRKGTRPLAVSGSFGRKVAAHNGTTIVTRRLVLKGRFDSTPPRMSVFLPSGGKKRQSRYITFNPLVNELDTTVFYKIGNGPWERGSKPLSLILSPGDNWVSFKAVDASGNESPVVFHRLDYQPRAGTYTGVLNSEGVPRGYFNLLVKEDGAFTGKLNIDGVTLRLNQSFNPEGLATIIITQKDGSVVAMHFEIVTNSDGSEIGCQVQVTPASAPPYLASGMGGRTIWDSAQEVQDVLGGSQFNLLLRADPSNVQAPSGSGVLRVTPNRLTSHITATGSLADGTRLKFSAPLSSRHEVPIFMKVKGKSLLAGTLVFDPSQPGSDLAGDLRWVRPPGPDAGDGWDTLLDVVGSRDYHPEYGLTLPLFPVREEMINGATVPVPSARLRFEGGELPAPLFLPIFCDVNHWLEAAFSPVTQRPLFDTVLKPSSPFAVGASGSWLPEGENQRIRFEILKVSKANLLGGYFIGSTGAGNVSVEAIP